MDLDGFFYDFELNRLHKDASKLVKMTQAEWTQYLKDNNIDTSIHKPFNKIKRDDQ